ncbi:MAG: hypothetical protein ACXWZG_05405 [Microbacterium sp.]
MWPSEASRGSGAEPRTGPSEASLTRAETAELDALHRRAYGPDADIFDDDAALARLRVLEDRSRQHRFPPAQEVPAPTEPSDAPSLSPRGSSAEVISVAPPRAPRWHGVLVASTATCAVLLGAPAWSAAREPVPAEAELFVSASNEELDARYRENYRTYVDGLRDDVLSLPGSDDVADRIIRDQLRPYGILYGRTVGVGATADHRFCMIIADLPEASVTCIPVENAYADPVSVELPAWYSDSDSNLFTGLGELIAYTLMPGGSVIAEPADSAAAIVLPDAATPAPTAIPPPGWQ